jgi:PKD domain-containing protein
MACSIAINRVNLIQGTPQRLRVLGSALGCLEVTLTTSPAVTTAATANPDGNGRFVLEADLSQQYICGAVFSPTVTVSCSIKSNPADTCLDAQWGGMPLPCCEGTITSVNAFVPQGSLTPTHIDVAGTCYGCASNQVTVSADKILPGGAPVPLITPVITQVNQRTGGFLGRFPIIASNVKCADEISVSAICSSGPCNISPFRGLLGCPQCFRAELDVMAAPCADQNDLTTLVTLTVRIGLRKGDVRAFELDFGNGQAPCTFTINNTAGGDDAIYQQVCTSTYDTNLQYTATLRIPTLPECPPVVRTFFVDCGGCPNATATATPGNCVTPGPGVNPQLVGSRPVTFTVDVPVGVPANVKATANFTYGGADRATQRTHSVIPLPSRMGPGQISEIIYLAPGTYFPTVTLIFTQGNQIFCPPQPALDLTTRPSGQQPAVDIQPCLECPVNVLVSKSQNPPAAPHWKFTADVNWGPAGPPLPPSVVYYDWTVTAPNGTDQATARTRIPAGQTAATNIITTEDGQGWSGLMTTVNGGVNLSQSGQYTVGVTAKYAHDSGLPLDPETLEVACNTTGATDFMITGQPPPNCQTLTGITSSTPAGSSTCADPTQSIVATVDFTASGTNLGPGPYQWDFGDPSSGTANTATTTTPTARHVYSAPGNYSVKATILAAGGCAKTEWMTGMTIQTCPCPPGQVRMSDGSCNSGPGGPEGLGCLILRWIAVALVSFGIITSLILACLWPSLSNLWQGIMLGVGIGATAIGIILFVIWVILCPVKPCLWGWLLAGQIAFAVALACIYFLPLWPWHMACCPWIFLISFAVFGIIAGVFMAIWIYRCMPTFCEVIIELVPIIADVILVVGWIAALKEVRDCLDPLGSAIVATLSAIGIFAIGVCATGGITTKTGGPTR